MAEATASEADRRLHHKGDTWDWTRFHKWSERVESGYRFRHPELGLVLHDSRIAGLGSCFADEVVRYLKDIGMDAWSFAHSRLYDTASLLQTVRHLLVEPQYGPEDMFRTADGRWAHPFRNPRIRTDTLDELLAWATKIEDEARENLRRADFVVITLGGTETWRDPASGRTYITMPLSDVFNCLPEERREVRVLGFEENVANIEAVYRLLREHVPGMRLILTVSPIRMTFSVLGTDVAVATSNAKSVLRAAAGDVVQRLGGAGDLFYFHSYELVQYPPPWLRAFRPDDVHVTEECVNAVMHEFARCFMAPEARPPEYELDELAIAAGGGVSAAESLAPYVGLSDVRRAAIRTLRTLRLERTARALYARAVRG